jgi:hypothetical protein
LTASKDITIVPSTNYADDAVYDFVFSENSMVPEGSYFRVDFPNDVQFDAEKILKLESCEPPTYTCTVATDNERSIIIKTIVQNERETEIHIVLGGIKNNRSF